MHGFLSHLALVETISSSLVVLNKTTVLVGVVGASAKDSASNVCKKSATEGMIETALKISSLTVQRSLIQLLVSVEKLLASLLVSIFSRARLVVLVPNGGSDCSLGVCFTVVRALLVLDSDTGYEDAALGKIDSLLLSLGLEEAVVCFFDFSIAVDEVGASFLRNWGCANAGNEAEKDSRLEEHHFECEVR